MHKKDFGLIAIEFFLVFLFFYSLLQMLGFPFHNGIKFNFEPILLFFSFLILVLIVLIFILIKKKFDYAFLLHKESSKIIIDTAKFKLKQSKEEPRIILLLFLELFFSFFIAYSFYAAFDPQAEYLAGIVEWSKLPLNSTEILIVKIIFFLLVTAIILWLYNTTKQFRDYVLAESPKDKLIKKLKKKLAKRKKQKA